MRQEIYIGATIILIAGLVQQKKTRLQIYPDFIIALIIH